MPAPTGGSAASTESSGSGCSTSPSSTAGTAEDAAILLAHAHQAELVVMVGSHTSLVEFLDRGRSGMASSFLTRAAVGSTVVDAKAVARLYRNRVRGWLVFALVLLGLAAVVAAIATTPVGQDWWHDIQELVGRGVRPGSRGGSRDDTAAADLSRSSPSAWHSPSASRWAPGRCAAARPRGDGGSGETASASCADRSPL